jgi:glycerophosphoryl diester phosphodiesterase
MLLLAALLLTPGQTLTVAHRGLFRHAPENTLAAFAACLDLRLGIELDVRRTKDGALVCLHDATLDRTTDGKGPLAERTLAEVQRLDAGRWFHPDFAGERVPTLDAALALVAARGHASTRVMFDLKIDDGKVEAEAVALAKKHGVLSRVVFIGTTISSPAVRKRLLAADAKAAVAVLAHERDDLPAALAERGAWAYIRFVPTAAEVKRIHDAGKKVFLVGPTVAGHEPKNWRVAKDAGVDAILTDYALECRAK